MNLIKQKLLGLMGAVSASLGGLGAIISSFGLCACVLAPIFSLVGLLSIVMGFLSKASIPLVVAGTFFIAVSFILHKKNKTCPVHRKQKH